MKQLKKEIAKLKKRIKKLEGAVFGEDVYTEDNNSCGDIPKYARGGHVWGHSENGL